MALLPTPWVRVIAQREKCTSRLICFPHSGGGVPAFADWGSIQDSVEVLVINLPGRNDRVAEPPLDSLPDLVGKVADALYEIGALVLPYAFFGHSFGAAIAFEVACELERRGRRGPYHLFASAEKAPCTVAAAGRGVSETEMMHTLSAKDFLAAVEKWGFLPEQVKEDTDLQEAVLPALRADIKMFETYTGSTGRLQCGVTAFGGTEDVAREEELRAWQYHGKEGNDFEVMMIPGDHFYLLGKEGLAKLMGSIERILQTAYSAIPYSIAEGGDVPRLSETRCVWEFVEELAAEHPDVIALEDVIRGPLTYSQTWELSKKIASLVHALLPKGEGTVGLMLPHSADYVCGMLGIWAAGGCFLVLERHHPPEMLVQVCSTCNPDGSGKPDVIVCTTDLLHNFPSILESVPKVLLDEGWDAAVDASGFVPPRPADRLDKRAIMMTTSGTSGVPKLIEGSHRFQLIGMMSRWGLAPYRGTPFTDRADREACSVMFVWEAPRALMQGHTCLVIPESVIIDPTGLADFLIEKRATRILTTPSLAGHVFDVLANDAEKAEKLQDRMDMWFFMGEVVTARLVRKALDTIPRVTMFNAYSTWEAADTAMLQFSREHLHPYSKFYPVGYLHEGVTAVVLDPATKRPVREGTQGELYTTGPQLAFGYAMAPDITSERYLELDLQEFGCGKGRRWYKSGDAAVLHPGGVLELQGRIDFTVKIRGFKVGLSFVEGAVNDVPEVGIGIVVPTLNEDTQQPEALAALLAPTDPSMAFSDLVALVKKGISNKLPKWSLPTFYLPVAEVATGDLRMGGEAKKVNRRAIPKLYTKQLKARQKSSSPMNVRTREGVEAAVAKVWAEVLDLDPASLDDDENFFELGGHSLLASTLTQKLTAATGVHVAVLDLYEHASLGALVKFIRPGSVSPIGNRSLRTTRRGVSADGAQIAIIGMAGRFPGADTLGQFWENLRKGEVSPTWLSKEFLAAKGVPNEVYNHPDYVRVAYAINDADKFDAKFWGIGRTEAMTMDPQHRVFIETAWHAIENAGYAPRSGFQGAGSVGVWAAAGIDGYLIHHLEGGALKTPLEPGNLFMTEVASEKDYIATRVSYLMNLRGPSMNVNSACSSGLVAVAQACQAILLGECDMAVAGASSISFPNLGFLYQDGLVYSKDGLVRPLDASADGTAFGDSVGAVVLKRLEDAERDGDFIWGVVKGFGTSNDGGGKAGYAAPSAAGQGDAIGKAMDMAQVDPATISYVEMHATGTLVGDGIEAKGLRDAWAQRTSLGEKQAPWCAVGSVKGNIAHANCAAGITGLIKTLLMLKHRELVPTANFSKLNDKVALDNTPFYVQDGAAPWKADHPLRAGVSSFGIGGTNAHIVLEEAPQTAVEEEAEHATPGQVLLVSAKSVASLQGTLKALASHLSTSKQRLRDVVHTLRIGREVFSYRMAVTAATMSDAATSLSKAAEVESVSAASRSPTVAFLFPGQGSQYFGMAKGLYANVPFFRERYDECCEILKAPALLAKDLRTVESSDFSAPSVLQPTLFAVEYALARLLLHLGVTPVALLGHSIGEYVAAVVGGHLSLSDALHIVSIRAKATESRVPAGAMLSVGASEEEARKAMHESPYSDKLWLAATNSPVHTVVSGTEEAVADLEKVMKSRGVKASQLHVNRAFHSDLMRPASEQLSPLQFNSPDIPTIPTLSNVTGGWMGEEAQDGAYWRDHMEKTVRYRDCCGTLAEAKPKICVEVGPGNTLSILTSKSLPADGRPAFEQAMRHAKAEGVGDVEVFAGLLGRLWCAGVPVDWDAWYQQVDTATRRRVPLPGYAFEKASHWTNPNASIYVTPSGGSPTPAAPAPRVLSAATVPRLVPLSAEGSAPLLKMYCLPFAGGSSISFARWPAAVPPTVGVVAVELPGRGVRAGEAVLRTDEEDERELEAVVEAIEEDAKGLPVVLVGKSMGGLLAVAAAQRLSTRVLGVVIAGRAPVRHTAAIPVLDDALAEEYAIGISDTVKASDAWRDFFLPLLIADLNSDRRMELRLSQSPPSPLECPCLVFCGSNDTVFPWETAEGWKVTAPQAEVRYLPGGHEFLTAHSHRIAEQAGKAAVGWLVAKRTAEISMLTASPAATVPPLPLFAVDWIREPLPDITGGVDAVAVPVGEPWTQELVDHLSAGRLVGVVGAMEHWQAGKSQCWGLMRWLQELFTGYSGSGGNLVLALPADRLGMMVGGCTKAVAFEAPELQITRVYLPDLSGNIQEAGNTALSIASRFPGEHDLDCTGGVSYPRLVDLKLKPALDAHGVVPVPKEGRILVTGWTGGLGHKVVAWLMEVGVAPQQLVLLTRRAASPPHPDCHVVEIGALDDPTDLAKANLGNITGILHLAGALDDGILLSQTEAKLGAVLRPKVAICEALLAAARQKAWKVEWLVGFSSTSSLLGYPGQSNYCAANSYLDGTARWGLPGMKVVAISWGPWGEVGMAKEGTKAHELALKEGDTPLKTRTALACLAEAFRGLGRRTQLAVCDVDWRKSPWSSLPIVSSVAPQPLKEVRPKHEQTLPNGKAQAATIIDSIQEWLTSQVEGQSWGAVADKDLASLGLDSLDTVQLRNAFQKAFQSVPLSLFARPNLTVRSLCDSLVQHCTA